MGSLGLIASNVQLLSCIPIGCISIALFKSANSCNVLGRLLIRLFSFILKAALETQAVKANDEFVQLAKKTPIEHLTAFVNNNQLNICICSKTRPTKQQQCASSEASTTSAYGHYQATPCYRDFSIASQEC